MAINNTEYTFKKQDIDNLQGASLLPIFVRREILSQYSKKELVELFANFMGLANSVVASTRTFVEEYLIVECKHFPQDAEKINLPTIQGALRGCLIAIEPVKGMCHGCAFRKGTAANQSPVTSIDAKDCVDDREQFMCHAEFDNEGRPTRKCVGYAREVAR